MTKQPSDALTVTIPINGDNQTIVDILQAQYGHLDAGEARGILETLYAGDVWNDAEVVAAFAVSHFDPPYVHVIRAQDGTRGTVLFIDSPRLYFSFNAEGDTDVTGTT